jgi:hypothetical protein
MTKQSPSNEVIDLDTRLQMESVAPSPAQEQEIPRESRAKIAVESPLGPESLCGSWAIYHGEVTKQALVVAEVFSGIFLLEFYDIHTDVPIEQRLLSIEQLAGDEAGSWSFYDDRASVRTAFRGMV